MPQIVYTMTTEELAELILEFQDAEDMDYADLIDTLDTHLKETRTDATS